jgi:outer membrane lipoprotein-sorting protein
MPAAFVPAVIAGAVVLAPLSAGALTPLPDKTPAEVLAMAASHQVHALSGKIDQDSELGLPQLPRGSATSGPGATTFLELLGSSHTARVYADGPTKVRVQVMDELAERDFVRNGSEAWLYNSRDNTATHVTGLEMLKRHGMKHDVGTRQGSPTPEALAQRLLAAADSSSTVVLGPEVRIAGRSAYQLVLTPKTSNTLVASAAVYVDGETGLPLGAEVKARNQQEPAFKVAFTELELSAPDAALFQFTPPEGAKVEEIGLASDMPVSPDAKLSPDSRLPVPKPGHTSPDAYPGGARMTGSGWETVVELPAAPIRQVLDSTPLLAQAAVPVAGGRLLSTSLLNILLTDDGRAFVGSVPVERLQAVATAP